MNGQLQLPDPDGWDWNKLLGEDVVADVEQSVGMLPQVSVDIPENGETVVGVTPWGTAFVCQQWAPEELVGCETTTQIAISSQMGFTAASVLAFSIVLGLLCDLRATYPHLEGMPQDLDLLPITPIDGLDDAEDWMNHYLGGSE